MDFFSDVVETFEAENVMREVRFFGLGSQKRVQRVPDAKNLRVELTEHSQRGSRVGEGLQVYCRDHESDPFVCIGRWSVFGSMKAVLPFRTTSRASHSPSLLQV